MQCLLERLEDCLAMDGNEWCRHEVSPRPKSREDEDYLGQSSVR